MHKHYWVNQPVKAYGLVLLIGEVKPQSYKEIFEEYQDVFKGIGCMPGEHKIVIDKDVPSVVNVCRKVPFPGHDMHGQIGTGQDGNTQSDR